MFRNVTVWALIGSLLCSGCVVYPHHHGGQLAKEYNAAALGKEGRPAGAASPGVRLAPFDAEYVLYAWQPVTAYPAARHDHDGWELFSRRLKSREPVGFRQRSGGIFAVAGSVQVPLPDGHYCWHVRPNTEPIDIGKTVLLVVAVVGTGGLALFFVAGAAAAAVLPVLLI